jgi:hypothetical protein
LEVVELALEHAQAIIDAVAVVLARSAVSLGLQRRECWIDGLRQRTESWSNSIPKAGLDW